jgi:mRNA deadenylase 3'-5' endonuclease subunit Ccr4
MFFSILDFEPNEGFYTKKMRLNPFDKTPPIGYKIALKRWIESIALEGIATKFILLDIHYMYEKVNDMVELLDVIDKMDSTSFLQDDSTSTFTIVSTTQTIILVVWKGLN